MSRHDATKVTPFELVYGQEAVLPVEVNLDAYGLAKQNDLSAIDYHDLMMDNIDGWLTSVWGSKEDWERQVSGGQNLQQNGKK